MRRSWPFLVLVWAAMAQPARIDTATPFQRLILEQCARYPKLDAQDLYKFAFQAAMGNEHLMTDTVSLFRYLTDELSSLAPGDSSEPLIEYLTPDSTLVRYNLRPFKARNGDPSSLLRAMLTTASTYIASRERLENWLREIRDLAMRNQIHISETGLAEYFSRLEAGGYSAIHHSKKYGQSYHPAYRVIARSQVTGISLHHK
ncbi:MAG TPA: hypothetical protein VJN65_07260 [Bacteroidota bacterium]|nr:hypothetical protein [Bacteroidota bacterium]